MRPPAMVLPKHLVDLRAPPPVRWRLTHALLLSLLIHTWLLSITFGGLDLWRFSFPWQDRWTEGSDLSVEVVPAQVTAPETAGTPTAEPSRRKRVEQPVASGAVLTPSEFAASTVPSVTAIAPEANVAAEVNQRSDAVASAVPAQTPLRADQSNDKASQPIATAEVIALDRINKETWFVPATPAIKTAPVIAPGAIALERMEKPTSLASATPAIKTAPVIAPATIALDRIDKATSVAPATPAIKTPPIITLSAIALERIDKATSIAPATPAIKTPPVIAPAAITLERIEKAAVVEPAAPAMTPPPVIAPAAIALERIEKPAPIAPIAETVLPSLRDELPKLDPSRQEAQQRAAQMETARQDAAKIEPANVEAAKIEAAKIEAAKIEAAKIEAAKIEAAKIEAAKIEAAKIEAAKIEAAKIEAARIEAARIEAARIEAEKLAAPQQAAERREAVLRAIGRQLDEEAAQRDAATAASRPSGSSSGARRYWLYGRSDPNAEVVEYAEAWSRKIELNLTFEAVREVVKQAHTDPLVTVAIRNDGSVESVTFVKSSGVAAIDDAIRRVIDNQRPYPAFPPDLARAFDVLHIRRTWHFDSAIRLD